jgi:hypothetical protein
MFWDSGMPPKVKKCKKKTKENNFLLCVFDEKAYSF